MDRAVRLQSRMPKPIGRPFPVKGADELYGEHERGGAAHFAVLESELGAAIERELAAAGVARPRLLTQLLLAASFGIGRKAQSIAELGPALRLLVDRLVRPELS